MFTFDFRDLFFNDFGKADADDKDDEDDKAHLYSAVVLSRFRAHGEAILGTQQCLYVRLQYVFLYNIF